AAVRRHDALVASRERTYVHARGRLRQLAVRVQPQHGRVLVRVGAPQLGRLRDLALAQRAGAVERGRLLRGDGGVLVAEALGSLAGERIGPEPMRQLAVWPPSPPPAVAAAITSAVRHHSRRDVAIARCRSTSTISRGISLIRSDSV